MTADIDSYLCVPYDTVKSLFEHKFISRDMVQQINPLISFDSIINNIYNESGFLYEREIFDIDGQTNFVKLLVSCVVRHWPKDVGCGGQYRYLADVDEGIGTGRPGHDFMFSSLVKYTVKGDFGEEPNEYLRYHVLSKLKDTVSFTKDGLFDYCMLPHTLDFLGFMPISQKDNCLLNCPELHFCYVLNVNAEDILPAPNMLRWVEESKLPSNPFLDLFLRGYDE